MSREDMAAFTRETSGDMAPFADWTLSLMLVRLATGHALANTELALD